ncbi:hypothetical protein EON65_31855 [archaeon]|nr:MAG: hypothetical protein EON65_31855 [archaeon]
MLKIRRMMLQKLFDGWRKESRELKTMRYKAAQILARMMRRTRGPLWVKESTLVCFHMWHRYAAVKNAYRHGEPDPRFQNPHLPQWTNLFKTLTVARVKKKKTKETGELLTQKRAFSLWAFMMTVDRSKPVTPLAVAISHFNTTLTKKMLFAWSNYLRERGERIRYRNKLFFIWKQWAPKYKKLRTFNHIASEWLRIKRVRKSFDVMISICLTVVGARTEKIKELRRNFCDRKVVICAYAIMNKDEHVIMVDCWRRLLHFYQMRKNWKALNAKFNYEYYRAKMKGK